MTDTGRQVLEDAAAHDEPLRLAAVRRYAILDTPPDGAFDRVCKLAARFFDVPVASVTIVDEDRIWFKACRGLEATEIPRYPGLCASAILSNEAYVVADAARDPRTLNNPLVRGELGLRFYAAAPIVTPDGFRLGTVNVIGPEPREVTAEELATLRDLAAVVMDELQLRLEARRRVALERERQARTAEEKARVERLAITLQRSLSPPRLPHVPGVELAVHHEPLADDVGGDFYDVFPLGAGRWGLFLGDVCGKGAAAAAQTSLARYTLRTAGMLEDEPAAVLGDLNSALTLERDSPMCTVIYGRLIPQPASGTAELALVVAGHPAPLILRADGSVVELELAGPMLGVFADPRFTPAAFTLRAGDTLLLYTDGLTEATIDGHFIEPAGLAAVLRAEPPGTAAGALRRVQELLGRADRPLRDDVAVLAIGVPRA